MVRTAPPQGQGSGWAQSTTASWPGWVGHARLHAMIGRLDASASAMRGQETYISHPSIHHPSSIVHRTYLVHLHHYIAIIHHIDHHSSSSLHRTSSITAIHPITASYIIHRTSSIVVSWFNLHLHRITIIPRRISSQSSPASSPHHIQKKHATTTPHRLPPTILGDLPSPNRPTIRIVGFHHHHRPHHLHSPGVAPTQLRRTLHVSARILV